MTDSPREEPRPDRLPQIKTKWHPKAICWPESAQAHVDVQWLVAEVERLREENEQMYRDFRELAEIEGLLDD